MGGGTSVWVSYISLFQPLLVFPVPVEAANRTLSSFHCIVAFSSFRNDIPHLDQWEELYTNTKTV